MASHEYYDGIVTEHQIQLLEEKRKAFQTALDQGTPDLDEKREDYQTYATELLIDLSGKLDPNPQTPVDTESPKKPTEGTKKDGGNTDPDTWKVAQMRDPPEKFKVVDNAGKNVATDFTTAIVANDYIKYYQWEKQQNAPAPDPPGPQPSGDRDEFGILCIAKSTDKKRVFTDFKLEEKMRNYQSGKKSEWSTEYTCDYKEHLDNVEVTIYEKINGFKKEPDSISLKLNGPLHHDGARFWLICQIMTDGSTDKCMEIEDPHPQNHHVKIKPNFEIKESIVGKWIGYKGISYVKDNVRHVEMWVHFPVADIDNVKDNQEDWRKYWAFETNEEKYLHATGSLATSRLDGVVKGNPPSFKYASVREIAA